MYQNQLTTINNSTVPSISEVKQAMSVAKDFFEWVNTPLSALHKEERQNCREAIQSLEEKYKNLTKNFDLNKASKKKLEVFFDSINKINKEIEIYRQRILTSIKEQKKQTGILVGVSVGGALVAAGLAGAIAFRNNHTLRH